jgi:hypothetical protein
MAGELRAETAEGEHAQCDHGLGGAEDVGPPVDHAQLRVGRPDQHVPSACPQASR